MVSSSVRLPIPRRDVVDQRRSVWATCHVRPRSVTPAERRCKWGGAKCVECSLPVRCTYCRTAIPEGRSGRW